MYRNLGLSENGFLFDSRTGSTFSLNSTGTFLLQELIKGTEPGGLPDKLRGKFDVSQVEAKRDVEQFLFRLKDLRITDDSGDDE